MKTLIVLVLLLVAAVSAVATAYGGVNLDDVTSAVSNAGAAEPARLLMCGAGLIVLAVALRRATFAFPKR